MLQEPFFSYRILEIDSNVILEISPAFYVYDNGVVRQLVRTQNSEEMEYWRVDSYRHVYTNELRWFSSVEYFPLIVHEITFDFENFSYTITEIAHEAWHEDPVFQERFEARDGDADWAWQEIWQIDWTETRLAAGYADDAIILRLLTDPDFEPEPPEMIWSDPLFSGLIPMPEEETPANLWLWILIAGAGGVVLGAASVAIPLIIRKRRKQQAGN